jgi:hypothetical protein
MIQERNLKMGNLYTIEIAFRGGKGSNVLHSIVTDAGYQHEGIFNVLWALSKTDSVVQFCVSLGKYNCDNQYFGFGNLEKWVDKITYFGE